VHGLRPKTSESFPQNYPMVSPELSSLGTCLAAVEGMVLDLRRSRP